jgi:hypothetical protein
MLDNICFSSSSAFDLKIASACLLPSAVKSVAGLPLRCVRDRTRHLLIILSILVVHHQR